jgi:hypothetical protein
MRLAAHRDQILRRRDRDPKNAATRATLRQVTAALNRLIAARASESN